MTHPVPLKRFRLASGEVPEVQPQSEGKFRMTIDRRIILWLVAFKRSKNFLNVLSIVQDLYDTRIKEPDENDDVHCAMSKEV